MAGTIRAKDQTPIIINGMPDHVHLAFRMRPNISVSDLLGAVKSNSSRWINKHRIIPHKFEWQRGFGVFSCNPSQIDTLVRYIRNQEEHHKRLPFREEYIGLLRDFDIDYEERYLFDWIDEF